MHRSVPARRSFPVLPALLGAVIVAVAGVSAGLLLAGQREEAAPSPTIQATDSARPGGTAASSAKPRAGTSTKTVAVVHGAAAQRMGVPILMYHVLGTPPASSALPDLWVSKARFREQLAALSRAGYQAITLKAAVGGWTGKNPLPRKPVVISFDDGYLSHALVAAPALRKYGWPGVLNVALRDLGPDGLPRHLAQKMAKEGWEIDSHTLTHPDLRNVDDARLKKELVGSRKAIAELVGTTPRFFCYPAGKYDARVASAVRAAGYAGATTVDPGVARRSDDRFLLPRVRITNADSGAALLQRLRAAG